MKTKTPILFLILALVTIASCKKEKPNALMSSDTLTISNWVYSAPSYYSDISYGAITQDVIDNGAVLVYFETSTGTWTQIPLTFYQSATYSTTIEVLTSVGSVRLLWTDSDLTQPNAPGAWNVKIVVIEPTNMPLYDQIVETTEKELGIR